MLTSDAEIPLVAKFAELSIKIIAAVITIEI